MLSVVCFKWNRPGYRSVFGPETVNTLHRMVRRHYAGAHRFICVTDDAAGLSADVEVLPLWNDFADIPSPHGGNNPSCYRRLKAFAPEARDWFGDRFVCIDLDTVIVRDITPILERPEEFICWGETDRRSWYNGSLWMMTAGARRQVYETFDPKTSPAKAKAAGRFGSDQGWLSYCLGPGEATWSRKDGVYSYRVHLKPLGGKLPADARMVMFHGHVDPWSKEARRLAWVQQHYQ